MDIMNAMKGNSNGNSIPQAESASSILYLEKVDGKWACVKHLKAEITSDEFIRSLYKQEVEKCSTLQHENILKYNLTLDAGHSFVMEKGCTAIENLVNEKPAILSTLSTIVRMTDGMLDALEYMHDNGVCQIDLTPQTLLLTKDRYEVRLFAPLSPYLALKNKLQLNSDFVAPEIMTDADCSEPVTADVYSAGKMIDYFYSFCKMPKGMKRIVRKATSEQPEERYQSIAELRDAIRKSKHVSTAIQALYYTIGVLAIAGYIFFTSSSDEGTQEYVQPAANSTHTFDSIEENNADALSGVEQISGDSAIADSLAAKVAGNPRQKEAEAMFRKEFARQAAWIINKVYNRSSLLGGNEAEFRSASAASMSKLQQIADRLTDTYKIPSAAAQQIATEEINSLTTARMAEIQKAK